MRLGGWAGPGGGGGGRGRGGGGLYRWSDRWRGGGGGRRWGLLLYDPCNPCRGRGGTLLSHPRHAAPSTPRGRTPPIRKCVSKARAPRALGPTRTPASGLAPHPTPQRNLGRRAESQLDLITPGAGSATCLHRARRRLFARVIEDSGPPARESGENTGLRDPRISYIPCFCALSRARGSGMPENTWVRPPPAGASPINYEVFVPPVPAFAAKYV